MVHACAAFAAILGPDGSSRNLTATWRQMSMSVMLLPFEDGIAHPYFLAPADFVYPSVHLPKATLVDEPRYVCYFSLEVLWLVHKSSLSQKTSTNYRDEPIPCPVPCHKWLVLVHHGEWTILRRIGAMSGWYFQHLINCSGVDDNVRPFCNPCAAPWWLGRLAS